MIITKRRENKNRRTGRCPDPPFARESGKQDLLHPLEQDKGELFVKGCPAAKAASVLSLDKGKDFSKSCKTEFYMGWNLKIHLRLCRKIKLFC